MIACPDCSSTHMGYAPCGMTYAQRLGTVVIDQTQLETREKHNYYDREAVDDVFGDDSEERMLDATKGLGPAKRDTRGDWWRQDRHSQEWVRVSEKEADQVYLGGDTEQVGGYEPGPV